MFREHPLRVLRYSFKSLWLLLFPVLRTSLRSPEEVLEGGYFLTWLDHAKPEFLVLGLLLVYGFLVWYCREIRVSEKGICIREGILIKRTLRLPAGGISSVTRSRPLRLVFFRGIILTAATAAAKRPALRLFIRERNSDAFQVLLQGKGGRRIRRRPGFLRTLLFSMFFSSSFSGALYLAAFWFQGGRMTGQLLEELRLTQRLSEVSERVAAQLAGIPPAAVSLAILILLCWTVSFFRNLLRYGRFSLEAGTQLLTLENGVLTRHRTVLRKGEVLHLDIRQSLPARIWGIASLQIHCPGSGGLPLCLPLMTWAELEELLPLLLDGTGLPANRFRPDISCLWSYVWKPTLAAALILPAGKLLQLLYPDFSGLLGFMRIMLLLPIFWKLLVQLTAFRTSGVSTWGRYICIRYSRGFTLHTVLADREALAGVQVTRTAWQNRRCSVSFDIP